MRVDLHLAEAAGWRGLLTQAQQRTQCFLNEAVEEYLVCLLYRSLGSAAAPASLRAAGFANVLLDAGQGSGQDLAAVGDQCLIFAGLFPEHAIRKGIPLSYFVQVGRQAYHEQAATARAEEPTLYRTLAEQFVPILDLFLTMRGFDRDQPGLDGLNAYQLWQDTGSMHGWHVLQKLTPALPASVTAAKH